MKYKYINLFSGIGGWELGLAGLPMENVLSCEIDKYARETFLANFSDLPCVRNGNYPTDVCALDAAQIPDFDILVASPPCQSFSMVGKRRGLLESSDSKGIMFLEVLRIIKARRPRAFILENVKGLLTAEHGKSFKVVSDLFRGAGYSFRHAVIRGDQCGIPQMRSRVFMVGFRNEWDEDCAFEFPAPAPLKFTMKDLFKCKECDREIAYTLLTMGYQKGLGVKYNFSTYLVDGQPRKLTIDEMKILMGLPTSFKMPVPARIQIKQLGNGVIADVVRMVAEQVVKYLQTGYKEVYNTPVAWASLSGDRHN